MFVAPFASLRPLDPAAAPGPPPRRRGAQVEGDAAHRIPTLAVRRGGPAVVRAAAALLAAALAAAAAAMLAAAAAVPGGRAGRGWG